MSPLIPLWIIGGPFIGLLILSFSFKRQSSMGGTTPRLAPREWNEALDQSSPMLDPMYPAAPRRIV